MESKAKVMPKKVKDIMRKPYARRFVPDETGGYVGSIHEFPGCIAEGESAEEAMKNLNEAAESWIQSAVGSGCEIREPVSFEGCSGKIALRVPRGLHKQVAELAELEDTSVNQLLVAAIAVYVGSKSASLTVSSSLLSEIKQTIREGFANFYRSTAVSIRIGIPIEPNVQHAMTIPPQRNVNALEMIAAAE